IAWRAKRPVISKLRWNVPHFVIDDHHALNHGSKPDNADLVNLVCPYLKKLLGCFDLTFSSHGARSIDQLDYLFDFGCRLDTLLTLGIVPLCVQWSEGEDHRIPHVNLCIAGERKGGRIVVPNLRHKII